VKNIPTGTVTFLFTDIESSTSLAREHPEAWETIRARHDSILREAVESNNGHIFQTIGDSFCVAFHKAGDALKAAIEAQRNLQNEPWGEVVIRVRMGIHTGEAEVQVQEYHGYLTLSLVQRVMSAGHGGQILLSNATKNLLQDHLPKDVYLSDRAEHKLKGMSQPVRLFQVVGPGLQSEFPALKTQDAYPNNLPVQLTDFIGREKELVEIAEALSQNRLVTLIGSGGTGKTRLAIEAGTAQLKNNQFVNGVFFISLAPLETIEVIVPTIASSLGFSFYGGGEPRQQLLDYLREKAMLLIVDNFEHLLSGVGLVTEILNSAPHIKILATSRARLNIQEEQLFHLTGMEFPNWESPQDAIEYSAVKLFTQTAHRVRSDFELTADNMKYVVRLCRLVDGMPLGILLAASWMEMLEPEEIAGEIEKSLDFLETRQRDLPDRQHSIRSVFDYSWKLLNSSEQNVFMKSSVFRGGFTREAAEQVTGASLRDLMELVDKSLLHRDPDGRFNIHELLRQYAEEKLSQVPNESDATKNQHSSYYANFLHQRETMLLGKNQKQALDEITNEIENISMSWNRASLQCCIENMKNSLECLAEYYDIRSKFTDAEFMFSTATKRLKKCLENKKDGSIELLHARIQMWQGYFASWSGDLKKSETLIRTSLAVLDKSDTQRDKAYALYFLGQSVLAWKDKKACYEQAIASFQEIGDRRGWALCLDSLSDVTVYTSEFELTIQLCLESLKIFEELGDDVWIAKLLDHLGYAYWLVGNYEKAKTYHQQSPAIHKKFGNCYAEADALNLLAIDLAALNDYEQGIQLLREALEISKEIGATLKTSVVLTNLAEIYNAMKDFKNAASCARESFLYNPNRSEWLTWSNRTLGEALVGLGDLQGARKYLHKSLEIAHTVQEKMDILLAIKAISFYFATKGENVKALELIVLINYHPAAWQWTKDRASELALQLEANLSPDVVAQAQERGRVLDLDTAVIKLLDGLRE